MEQEQQRKVREDAASKQNMSRYKEQFGGGAKGEVLARTLRKLHLAYEQGIELLEEEARSERTETESAWSDYYSSTIA